MTLAELVIENADAYVLSDIGTLSQLQLTVRRFRKNRLAVAGLVGLVIMYLLVALAPFLAPENHETQDMDYAYCPPSPITFVGPNGRIGLRPYTYSMRTVLDP